VALHFRGQTRGAQGGAARYGYDKPGIYNILVKVINIFSIDTSQLFEMKVT
jgi:hypothetical protein